MTRYERPLTCTDIMDMLGVSQQKAGLLLKDCPTHFRMGPKRVVKKKDFENYINTLRRWEGRQPK